MLAALLKHTDTTKFYIPWGCTVWKHTKKKLATPLSNRDSLAYLVILIKINHLCLHILQVLAVSALWSRVCGNCKMPTTASVGTTQINMEWENQVISGIPTKWTYLVDCLCCLHGEILHCHVMMMWLLVLQDLAAEVSVVVPKYPGTWIPSTPRWNTQWPGTGTVLAWSPPVRTSSVFCNLFQYIIYLFIFQGHAVVQLVQKMCYKPESRGFDSQSCHWNSSLI